ncbi:MAG: sensor histidine kinase [Candidatus Limnocylindria bacterium]
MHSPRTDTAADRSAASSRLRIRDGIGGFFQRLNVRLVVALAFVSIIALTVSGLAITQILPDYFRRQAEERLETAAISVALIAQQIADAEREERPGVILEPELRPLIVFRPAARLAAGPVIPATITILDEQGQILAEALPANVAEFESQGLRLDSEVPTYRTDFIPLFLDDERDIAVRYQVVLSQAYTSRETTLAQIRATLVSAGILALVGSVVVGALVAARFAEPISALRRVAGRVAQGHLDERASASGVLEIDELGAQFNVMADRLSGTLRMLEADRDQLREFIADVSHELRTPIAALRMYNELQRDGKVDEAERAEFLDRSTEQIRRLEWMSTNLLDLSRIDAGIFPLDVRDGDLRDPIQSVVQAHAEVAERRGIGLGSEVPGSAVELRFDRERIVQLLTNLVGNALKFTPPGGDVELRLLEEADSVTVEVRDTGPGIPAEELPRIFERFYRGTNTGDARASGSGLGLAIVRSIVEMHGGEINVASVVGEGSIFRIRLPRDLDLPNGQLGAEAAGASFAEEKD